MNEDKLVENELNLLESKIELLKKYRYDLKQKSDRKFIVMMLINCIIILLSAVVPLTLIPEIGQLISTIIFLSSIIGLTGTNFLLGYKAIKKNEKKRNNLNEEISYLEDTKNKMKDEIINTKENNININNISSKFDWRKQLNLIRTYHANKNIFMKHYQKDDLYELLTYNYNNMDVYYLYERTRKDAEKKQKQKVLTKDLISDLWKD